MCEIKCPDCGEEQEHMLTVREGKVISCARCDYSECPNCGSELNELIGYVMGHKTSSGFNCPNCDWKEAW